MSQKKYILTATVTLLIAVVAVLAVFTYISSSKKAVEREAYNFLSAIHSDILTIQTDVLRGAAVKGKEALFPECPERSEHDRYLSADSRTLSKAELEEALLVHDMCGSSVYKAREDSLRVLEGEFDEFLRAAEILSRSSIASVIKRSSTLWNEYISLEQERIAFLKQTVRIQEDFWETELDHLTGVYTVKDREDVMATLNDRARNINTRLADISTRVEEIKEEDSEIWGKIDSHFGN